MYFRRLISPRRQYFPAATHIHLGSFVICSGFFYFCGTENLQTLKQNNEVSPPHTPPLQKLGKKKYVLKFMTWCWFQASSMDNWHSRSSAFKCIFQGLKPSWGGGGMINKALEKHLKGVFSLIWTMITATAKKTNTPLSREESSTVYWLILFF